MSQQLVTALAALAIGGGILWSGRHDVTRPAVAFGVPWFATLALAQLRLTDIERPWSTGFTLVAFGGGIVFVIAALLVSGTAGARGAAFVERERISGRRLVIAALVLIGGAVLGAIYRANVLDGVPLLAENPDVVRARAFSNDVPPWSSALTGGFYLGLWATLAAIWVLSPHMPRRRLAPLWLLSAAALFGVALEASRNLLVFALVVPALGAYLLGGARGRRAQLGWFTAAICVLVVGVGGLFLLRVARGDGNAHTYISEELDRQPPIARPILPLYVNAAFPIEADRRVFEAVPGELPYEAGAASFASLPSKLFPEGKTHLPRRVAELMDDNPGSTSLSWTVSSYQGRLLADLGWPGVMLGSALLGLAAGGLYRWARGRVGFVAVAVIGYVAYYSAYMVYDNALSFSLISIYDLAVITVVSAYCLGRTDAAVGAFKQLVRGLAAEKKSA